MRQQWKQWLKNLRSWAAPVAASLLATPCLMAQSSVDAITSGEGRVNLAGAPLQQQIDPYFNNQYSYALPAHQVPTSPQPIGERTSRYGHLDAANMVGAYFGPIQSISFSTTTVDPVLLSTEIASGSFVVPGANRVPNIAENNSPIPKDRVYFAFNHFHGALGSNISVDDPNDILLDMDGNPIPGPFGEPLSVPAATSNRTLGQDRYTLGFEKKFFGDDFSIEVRLPLVTQVKEAIPSFSDPTVNAVSYGMDDSNGNMSINLKRVLTHWEGPYASGIITGGVGFMFASSDRTQVNIADGTFYVDDSAYHVNPFLAVLISGQGRWFAQAFFEADYSTDNISVSDADGTVGTIGVPDYYNMDLGFGYWLTRHLDRRFMRGVAPLLELHYARARQDSGSFNFSPNGTNTLGSLSFGSQDTRQDSWSFTTGMQVDISRHANARVAGVFPFNKAPDRQFDSAVIFQLDFVR